MQRLSHGTLWGIHTNLFQMPGQARHDSLYGCHPGLDPGSKTKYESI